MARLAGLSTVKIVSGRGALGSGVITDRNGRIVTNAHVAFRPTLDVELHDGRVVVGRVTRRDPGHDLATIQVEGADLDPLAFADSDRVRPGQIVVSLGNPAGISNALAFGVVHAAAVRDPRENEGMIAADLRLAPGFSGGPMLDAAGRLVGINTMIAGGLALAIPSNRVSGFVSRDAGPRLGFHVLPLHIDGGAEGNQPTGLIVTEVAEASLAARHGLILGDIITRVGGMWVRNGLDLARALREAPGTICLHFVRAGRAMTVTISFDAVPSNHGETDLAA